VGLSDVVDELLNQHGLADANTAKQTNLSTTDVGGEQADDLDTGHQDFSGGGLFIEGWRVGMDRVEVNALGRTLLVNGLAFMMRTFPTGILIGTPVLTVLGTVHSNVSDRILANVSSGLKDEMTTVEVLDFKSIGDGRQVLGLELYFHDCTNNSFDMPHCVGSLRSIRACCNTRINASEYIPNVFRRVACC